MQWKQRGWWFGGCSAAVVFLLAGSVQGQEILYRWMGDQHGADYGDFVSKAGDVDGDGMHDFFVGAPLYDGETYNDVGRVFLYSGRTGELISIFEGVGTAYHRARACDLGDTNGDGRSDFVVGGDGIFCVSGGAGRIDFIDAATYNIMHEVCGPGQSAHMKLGGTIPDLDGDGVNEVLGLTPEAALSQGMVTLYSGATSDDLINFFGEGAFHDFGKAAAGGGDVDGDGIGDFIIGADFDATGKGKIYVYSGATQELMRTHVGQNTGDSIGFPVALIGDLNLDGHDEYMTTGGGAANGKNETYMYSGQDGALLETYQGVDEDDRFGMVLAGVGDVNADGVPDYVITDAERDGIGEFSGLVIVYSGRTRKGMYRFFGQQDEETLGSSVAGAGDVNGDGIDDILVGAPFYKENGEWVGAAYVFAGNDLFLRADLPEPSPGETVKLLTRGGDPFAPAHLFLTGIDGQPVNILLSSNTLDEDGHWTYSLKTSGLSSGTEITLQSFSQNNHLAAKDRKATAPGPNPGRPFRDSSPVTITVQ